MILAIEIGNTNIVLGGINGETIQFVARMATDTVKTEDQYSVDMKNILELYGVKLSEITGSVISSVVPPALNTVKAAVSHLMGRAPLVVGPGVKTGLNILIENPSGMGSDLIADAVAGIRQYSLPLIIIDMGTATTISVVDENRNYLGGCVTAGVNISLDALFRRTAQLPGISLEQPKKVVGRSTVECMRSGVLCGHAAMLEGMIVRIEEELEQKATVLATGGVAKLILPLCRREIIYDEELELKGLGIIYRKNMEK